MVIQDGEDEGKLTVAMQSNKRPWEYVPDPRFMPVDCYNIMDDSLDLAANAQMFDDYLASRSRTSFPEYRAAKSVA